MGVADIGAKVLTASGAEVVAVPELAVATNPAPFTLLSEVRTTVTVVEVTVTELAEGPVKERIRFAPIAPVPLYTLTKSY
jgi:hypothetical protein